MIYIYYFRNLAELGGQKCVKLPQHKKQLLDTLKALESCFEIFFLSADEDRPGFRPEVSPQAHLSPGSRKTFAELSAVWANEIAKPAGFALALVPRLEAGWLRWPTHAMVPSPSAPEIGHDARTGMMLWQLKRELGRGCRLFVGPECSIRKGTKEKPEPYTALEMLELHKSLARVTAGNDLALVVLGTAYWVDEKKRVRNSLLAYSGGMNLCEKIEYDKMHWTAEEESGVPSGCTLCKGEQAYFILTWHTLTICVQICADSAVDPCMDLDIHIIVGNNTGLAPLRNRVGGIGVHVDAIGMGTFVDSYGKHQVKAISSTRQLSLAWTPLFRTQRAKPVSHSLSPE